MCTCYICITVSPVILFNFNFLSLTDKKTFARTNKNMAFHGPLARYVKLRVVHAPGMLGTFSSHPRISDPDMHHGTCVTHVLWCMPASLTSGWPWSRWWEKCSRHSRRMRTPQFYVSGKRPIAWPLQRSDLQSITWVSLALHTHQL